MTLSLRDAADGERALPHIRSEHQEPDGQPGKDWVALQFDDRVFVMSRASLVSEPHSLFAALFSEDSVSGSSLDRNFSHPLKPVVFDRSPDYVKPILHYLRVGELLFADEKDIAFIRGVYLEAEYFGVSGVMDTISDLFPQATKSLTERRREAREAEAHRGKPNTATRIDVERMLMNAPEAARLKWRGMRFNGVDFSELYLARIDFTGCELNGCRFVNCDMTDANLTDAELEGADFTRAKLHNTCLYRALATNATFCYADCNAGDFRQGVFVGADFTQARLQQCTFESSDMSACKLAGADLRGAKLQKALLHNVERQGTALSMGGVIMR